MSNTDTDARTHILDASVVLFSAHGYRETSIREISRKASVNVSMISYYFGGKDGILQDIVKSVTEGFSSLLSQFDLQNIDVTVNVLKRFLEYLESNRPQIKILLSELGKGYDYLIPIKKKITELQVKLGSLISGENDSSSSSDLAWKLKIMTNILLGMIFSDYVIDFSSFQDSIPDKEKKMWREERMQMLIKIIKQLSGVNAGELTFESIF